MTTPFTTDHVRLIDKYRLNADKPAADAAAWTDKLASAEVEADGAKAAFLATFSDHDAATLAQANLHVANCAAAVAAIEDIGGPSEIRERELRSPGVFAAFAAGFDERAKAIERLIPLTRKQLGERRALLSENGVHISQIEADQIVAALRTFCDVLTTALAVAVFGKNYASKRGEGHALKSFDSLYNDLTNPIPQAPKIPG